MGEAEKFAVQWGVPLSIAIVAVGVRYLVNADKATLFGIIRGVVIGLFVGALVNLYLIDIDSLTAGEKGAIIGVACMLSEDIVMAILKLGKQLRDDPYSIITSLIKRK